MDPDPNPGGPITLGSGGSGSGFGSGSATLIKSNVEVSHQNQKKNYPECLTQDVKKFRSQQSQICNSAIIVSLILGCET
jgi:hypothetical protein